MIGVLLCLARRVQVDGRRPGLAELTWRFTLMQPADDEATRYFPNPAVPVVFVEG